MDPQDSYTDQHENSHADSPINQQDSHADQQDQSSPMDQQDSHTDQQDKPTTNQQDSHTYKQNIYINQQDSCADQQNSHADQQDRPADQQDRPTDQQDIPTDQQDRSTDQQDSHTNQHDKPTDQQDRPTDQKDSHTDQQEKENSQETVFNQFVSDEVVIARTILKKNSDSILNSIQRDRVKKLKEGIAGGSITTPSGSSDGGNVDANHEDEGVHLFDVKKMDSEEEAEDRNSSGMLVQSIPNTLDSLTDSIAQDTVYTMDSLTLEAENIAKRTGDTGIAALGKSKEKNDEKALNTSHEMEKCRFDSGSKSKGKKNEKALNTTEKRRFDSGSEKHSKSKDESTTEKRRFDSGSEKHSKKVLPWYKRKRSKQQSEQPMDSPPQNTGNTSSHWRGETFLEPGSVNENPGDNSEMGECMDYSSPYAARNIVGEPKGHSKKAQSSSLNATVRTKARNAVHLPPLSKSSAVVANQRPPVNNWMENSDSSVPNIFKNNVLVVNPPKERTNLTPIQKMPAADMRKPGVNVFAHDGIGKTDRGYGKRYAERLRREENSGYFQPSPQPVGYLQRHLRALSLGKGTSMPPHSTSG